MADDTPEPADIQALADEIRREMASVRAVVGEVQASLDQVQQDVRQAASRSSSGQAPSGGGHRRNPFQEYIETVINEPFRHGIRDLLGLNEGDEPPPRRAEEPAEPPRTPPEASRPVYPTDVPPFDTGAFGTPPEAMALADLVPEGHTGQVETGGPVIQPAADEPVAATQTPVGEPIMPEAVFRELAGAPTPLELPEPLAPSSMSLPETEATVEAPQRASVEAPPTVQSLSAEIGDYFSASPGAAPGPVELPPPLQVSASQSPFAEEMRGPAESSGALLPDNEGHRAPLLPEMERAPYRHAEIEQDRTEDAQRGQEETGGHTRGLAAEIRELTDVVKELLVLLREQVHESRQSRPAGLGAPAESGMAHPGHQVQPSRPAPQDHGRAGGELNMAIGHALMRAAAAL